MKLVGGVYLDASSSQREPQYVFFKGECKSFLHYKLVCPYEIEFELPDGMIPVQLQIQALEEKIVSMNSINFDAVQAMRERISKLQCLEFTA